MKPLSEALRRRLKRPNTDCRTYVEALVRKAEDLRLRKSEWDALSLSNVETFADGAVRLTTTSAAKISHSTGSTDITSITSTLPRTALLWELDASIGGRPALSKVRLYLHRKRDSGQPVFDGFFTVQPFRIARYGIYAGATDFWELVPAADPVRVYASAMTADDQLVDFAFNATTTGFVFVDETFLPPEPLSFGLVAAPTTRLTGRCVVLLVTAHGGTNTNYGLRTDTGAAADVATGGAGTLRHRTLSAQVTFPTQIAGAATVTAPSPAAMVRCELQLGSYPASGSVTASGASKCDLGASVQGTVEFVVQKEEPTGTTCLVEARVTSPDAWVTVKDGQTPADVGLGASQSYEMRATLTANAGQDVTPTLRLFGILDRITTDVTELTRADGFSEQVDPGTGEVKLAEGTLTLVKTGVRDFRDAVTKLFSENYFADIEFRAFVGHPDLARDQWCHLDTWRVDDYDPDETEITAVVVSCLERLKGKYPRATGTVSGLLLKAATSDVTGGTHLDDFNRELSETAETAGTISVSVAASATESSRGVSAPNRPGILQWPTGNWAVKVEVTVANSNLFLSLAVARINASGVEQQISAYTPEQQLSSVTTYTFQLGNLTWLAGALTDRLKVVYRFRNNVASTQAVTIRTGTTNTEVLPPWQATTEEAAKLYNLVSIQSAYEDWRDVQIALLERYRGASPADSDVVRKEVRGADGKRELERLAFLAGGTVISSQGRVKFVPLVRPTFVAQAFFPIEEYAPRGVSLGLRARTPEIRVPYAYGDQTVGFRGQIKFVHADALARFGPSRIDNPPRELEEETALWIPNEGLAVRVGEPLVQSLGVGLLVVTVVPTIPHPEVEIGDAAGVEMTQLVGRHPSTGAALLGHVWGFGVVIGTRGLLHGREFRVWLRDYNALYSVTTTVERRASYELPIVEATVLSVPSQPQNAVVRLRAYPADATILWTQHADGTAPPRYDAATWATYSVPVTVARDQSADTLVSYFARLNGQAGKIQTVRVAPDKTPTILSLTASQAGTSPNVQVTWQATPDPDVRRIRWYLRKGSWPTVDGTQGAALSDTFFFYDKHVELNGGGFDFLGGVQAGGLTANVASVVYATSDVAYCIAVPLDVDGNVGPRKEASYTVTGGTPPSVTPLGHTLDTAGTSCSALRKYDFTWTPAGIDDTYELRLYATINGRRDLIYTETSPNTNTSANAVEVLAYPYSGQADVEIDFDYELYNSTPTLVAAHGFGTGDGFKGQVCAA